MDPANASKPTFLSTRTFFRAATYLWLWWTTQDIAYLRTLNHIHYERLVAKIPSIWH